MNAETDIRGITNSFKEYKGIVLVLAGDANWVGNKFAYGHLVQFNVELQLTQRKAT